MAKTPATDFNKPEENEETPAATKVTPEPTPAKPATEPKPFAS